MLCHQQPVASPSSNSSILGLPLLPLQDKESLPATAPRSQHAAEHLSHAPKWAKTRCECARLASQGHRGSAGTLKIAVSLATGSGGELLLSSPLKRVKAITIPCYTRSLSSLDLGGPNRGVQLRVALLTVWSRVVALCLLDPEELLLLVKLTGLTSAAFQDTSHARFAGVCGCLA